jgi:hypothetical protein
MGLGLMAIGTDAVWYRRLEIPALVASDTGDTGVLAEQRKLCFGVVEGSGEGRLLPGKRCVTRDAILLEFALVRIRVAGGAGRELEPCVPRLPVIPLGVALQAGRVQVQADQLEAGL